MKVTNTGNKYVFDIEGVCTLVGTIRGRKAKIESLVVWNEEDRKQGYGSNLVAAFLKLCADKKVAECKVISSPRAVSFYKRFGFLGDLCKLTLKFNAETAWTYSNPKIKIKTPDVLRISKDLPKVVEALTQLVKWLNRPLRDTGQNLKLSDLKILVKHFGYDPYIGEVYRGMRVNTTRELRVGSKLKLPVGKYKLTSWSVNKLGARAFAKRLGKKMPVVVGRLISSELQVASILWAKAIAKHLHTLDCKELNDKVLASYKAMDKYLDDEEEIIMLIETSARVEVMEVL